MMGFRSRRVAAAAGIAALGWSFGAVAAGAITFPLGVELDDGLTGEFGVVEVSEAGGGDLLFEIRLNPTLLGSEADLHAFYFNLPASFSGVSLTSSDAVATPYVLAESPPVAGGAGSSFAYGVDFGSGGGPAGNGRRERATFVLTADTDLAIDDLLVPSLTKRDLALFFAVHVQGTALTRSDSEALGASVPEAGTLALGGLALLALRRAARRRG